MPTFKTLTELEDYLWRKLGYVDMETVRHILDVVKTNQRLLKEHQ